MKWVLVNNMDEIVDTCEIASGVGVSGAKTYFMGIKRLKGKEFDNCIVDLAIHREEDDFTKRRIKYVACSRAKKTLWIIKSRNGMTL